MHVSPCQPPFSPPCINDFSQTLRSNLLYSCFHRTAPRDEGWTRKVSKFKNFSRRSHLDDKRARQSKAPFFQASSYFILNWIYHKFLISKKHKIIFWCMLFHCHKLTTFLLTFFVCYLCRCIGLCAFSPSTFFSPHPKTSIFCRQQNILSQFKDFGALVLLLLPLLNFYYLKAPILAFPSRKIVYAVGWWTCRYWGWKAKKAEKGFFSAYLFIKYLSAYFSLARWNEMICWFYTQIGLRRTLQSLWRQLFPRHQRTNTLNF